MYFKDFLRYRQSWLGVAMFGILLFHLPFQFHADLVNCVHLFGYGGVDICFFASGIGSFYSLTSNPDPGSFLKRRLKRLLPTYLIFIVFWLIYQYIIGCFNLQMALGNILAIYYLTGLDGSFNWYISAIFLFYLLAPYFKSYIDGASPRGKWLFLLFLLLLSVCFWSMDLYIVFVVRLMVFYLGMLFADLCQRSVKVTRKHILTGIAMLVAGVVMLLTFFFGAPRYLWSHGLHWYPFVLITAPVCVMISLVMPLLEKYRITRSIVSFFSLCGDYSFELYLIHLPLIDIIHSYMKKHDIFAEEHPLWLAGIPVLVICCFLLRRLTVLYETLRAKRSTNA